MKAMNFVARTKKPSLGGESVQHARLETHVLKALEKGGVFTKARAHDAFAGLKKRPR